MVDADVIVLRHIGQHHVAHVAGTGRPVDLVRVNDAYRRRAIDLSKQDPPLVALDPDGRFLFLTGFGYAALGRTA